jgi:hypothetical protein
VSVTPLGPKPNAGFVVTMHLADLSDAALTAAMSSGQVASPGSLVYAFRFVDGFQSAAAVARYDAAQGWQFGYNGYTGATAECLGTTDAKCLTYPGNESTGDGAGVTGKVDQATGTITLSVPGRILKALGALDSSKQRPTEVAATYGARVYDATVFTFLNPVPASQEQGFMAQVDNAPAFDFLLGVPAGTVVPPVKPPVVKPPVVTPPKTPGGGLAATGLPWALPALGGLLLVVAAARRRAARG